MTRGRKAAKTERVEPEGYTQEEIARLVGCAQSTVSKAIRRGDVTTLANGRLPKDAAEQLRAIWKEDQAAATETADLERRLKVAETEKAEAQAKLKAVELEREVGRFVALDEVLKDARDMRERILAVLRAVPQRTATALECPCARAAVVQAKIGEEIERAIAELGESKYAKEGA